MLFNTIELSHAKDKCALVPLCVCVCVLNAAEGESAIFFPVEEIHGSGSETLGRLWSMKRCSPDDKKERVPKFQRGLLMHQVKWLVFLLTHRSSKVDQKKKSYDLDINMWEDEDDCKPIKSDICIYLKSKDTILEVWIKLPISPRTRTIQVKIWSTVEIITPISYTGQSWSLEN